MDFEGGFDLVKGLDFHYVSGQNADQDAEDDTAGHEVERVHEVGNAPVSASGSVKGGR